MLSLVTSLATFVLIVLKYCFIKCLFRRNPTLLKQIMLMIKLFLLIFDPLVFPSILY